MTALPDGDQFLPDQTAAQRASDYPYLAPQGGFVLDRGQLHVFDDAALLAGRTAVLSVGSNRAPVQLLRKFGPDALVPVTLQSCMIVISFIMRLSAIMVRYPAPPSRVSGPMSC